MRVRKKKWAEEEISNSKQIVELGGEFTGDWSKYFGNMNGICVEVGSGKGKFINEMAQKNPDKNFVGFERSKQVGAMAIKTANKNYLANLAFVIDNASNLSKYFAMNNIEKLYLNFSDPWPKKRHIKRRLTSINFLKIYKGVLASNGAIYFKTDNKELFEFTLNEFCDNGWQLRNITFDLHKTNLPNVTTEYEEKFSKMGKPIMYCEARFKGENVSHD